MQQDVLHGATLISERTREAPLPWAPDDRSPQHDERRAPAPISGPSRRRRARPDLPAPQGPTGTELLEGVYDVDLDALDVELPRGFGRD